MVCSLRTFKSAREARFPVFVQRNAVENEISWLPEGNYFVISANNIRIKSVTLPDSVGNATGNLFSRFDGRRCTDNSPNSANWSEKRLAAWKK